MCVGLPLLAALALVVPERRWSASCRGIERMRAHIGQAPSALVDGLRLGGFDAPDDAVRVRAAQLEHHLQVLRERLTGWDADIVLDGREHLERARQQGRGAVLWVAHFAFNALAVKIALAASVTALLIWQERARERARLSELDERVLKDMGMTRGDAMRESHKAPWRP